MPYRFPGLRIQDTPPILVMNVPGKWLLERTTPQWRIKDPKKGFQRVVKDERCTSIATAVLDQQRTFPNAIVLATDETDLKVHDCTVVLPNGIRFLVVDGQHRLWSQTFSSFEATYCCVVHLGLTEKEMAQLFIEINDNQKRVPSSLRWDLVRLVRPDRDPHGLRAVDLIYDLATQRGSALFQKIDLTGETKKITLSQGSLAPSIKALISRSDSPLHGEGYPVQLDILKAYFAAMRECDVQGWRSGEGELYRARVVRALLRLLPEIIKDLNKPLHEVRARDVLRYLKRIDRGQLNTETIRGLQGSAGIKAIYTTIRSQVFGQE